MGSTRIDYPLTCELSEQVKLLGRMWRSMLSGVQAEMLEGKTKEEPALQRSYGKILLFKKRTKCFSTNSFYK